MSKIAAEICLYGTGTIGAGWLAQTADGAMLGDGEPRQGRGFTEAVWIAADALRKAGVTCGVVRIFAAGGRLCADVRLERTIPYFGNLPFKPAEPALVISGEQVEAAAQR